jgi:hypothetical protein
MVLNKWSIVIGIFLGLSLYSVYFNIISTPSDAGIGSASSGNEHPNKITRDGNGLRASLDHLLPGAKENSGASAVGAKIAEAKPLTKFEVCLSLRNAILAAHRGEVKRLANEEAQLQTFWDKLHCASEDLPLPPATKQHQIQRNDVKEQRLPQDKEHPFDDDAPHAALLALASVPDFSNSPVAIECTAMKRDHCMEPGKSWGKLSKAQQA